jgi:hypothetical protein
MDADDDYQIGYQALGRGVPVVTSDGVTVGTVHRVLDNAREHIFDGIVIATDDGQRFVDAPEVARITRRRVTLSIDSEAAKVLPSPRAAKKKRGRHWWQRLGR